MQNKKSLLQRLLVIYITFFIVLVASIAHGILPNFSRGAAEGAELGNDIAEKGKSGVPRMIYMLGDIRVTGQPETAVEIAAAPGVEIKANVRSRTPRAHPRWGWHSVRSAAAHGSMRWLCSARFSIWPSSY